MSVSKSVQTNSELLIFDGKPSWGVAFPLLLPQSNKTLFAVSQSIPRITSNLFNGAQIKSTIDSCPSTLTMQLKQTSFVTNPLPVGVDTVNSYGNRYTLRPSCFM